MSEQLQNVPSYLTIVQLQQTTNDSYCYVAFHPELPDVLSQGDTAQEAKENLTEATELALAHLATNSLPIPKPMASTEGFSTIPESESSSPVIIDKVSFKSLVTPGSDQEIMTIPSGQVVTL